MPGTKKIDCRVIRTGRLAKQKTLLVGGADNGARQRVMGACAVDKAQWVYFCKYTFKIDGIIY